MISYCPGCISAIADVGARPLGSIVRKESVNFSVAPNFKGHKSLCFSYLVLQSQNSGYPDEKCHS